MEQTYAFIGFGKIGEGAIRYISSVLHQEESSDRYNGCTCILITRSWDLSGQNRSTTLRTMGEDDVLDNAPRVILILVDTNDSSAMDRAILAIKRAKNAGVWLRIAIGQCLTKCAIEKYAQAFVSMRDTVPGIALPEQMGRLAMALMPFALVGTERECMDFFDPVDLETIIQGQVQASLQRISLGRHSRGFSKLIFRSIAGRSSHAPTGVFLSLGGCAPGLIDQLGPTCAVLGDAISAMYPRDAPDIPLASACYVDVTLGSELEIVTCVSKSYS